MQVRALALSFINNGGYKLNPYPLMDLSTLLMMEVSFMTTDDLLKALFHVVYVNVRRFYRSFFGCVSGIRSGIILQILWSCDLCR